MVPPKAQLRSRNHNSTEVNAKKCPRISCANKVSPLQGDEIGTQKEKKLPSPLGEGILRYALCFTSHIPA